MYESDIHRARATYLRELKRQLAYADKNSDEQYMFRDVGCCIATSSYWCVHSLQSSYKVLACQLGSRSKFSSGVR